MAVYAVRERLEQAEERLSPFAQRSRLSWGRQRPEDPDPLRTAFQRDRDRILHTKAFRRLKHKTQVFIAPLGDHYVTRLTHTLEVSQIARTIARSLNLNEDLEEAMSLGHDLGHAPFGHVGEETLNELLPEGFRHNLQSLRVVDVLEKEGQGLNLTWEVRDGILSHSKGRDTVMRQEFGDQTTLEAQICRIADAIAYINHDIGDAIRAGLLTEQALPGEATQLLGHSSSQRINTLVWDIVRSSWTTTGTVPLAEGQHPVIQMSTLVIHAVDLLRDFLFQEVYIPAGQSEPAQRAQEALRLLYRHFVRNPDKVPEEYHLRKESPERMAVDYISGMTDRYALRLAEELKPGIARGVEFDVIL